jgi:hypothetical protein
VRRGRQGATGAAKKLNGALGVILLAARRQLNAQSV